MHLYYNSHIAAAVTDGFTEELLGYKEELENDLLISGHEQAYKTFFTVKETPVRRCKVLFNHEAIQRSEKRCGTPGLLTSTASGNCFWKWKPLLKYAIPANTATS